MMSLAMGSPLAKISTDWQPYSRALVMYNAFFYYITDSMRVVLPCYL